MEPSVRTRRFPAEQAVWLVIGIGLMRNRSIPEVFHSKGFKWQSAGRAVFL
ncbi:transposase domain-containing protein [Parendozoicomonas callyspongiae]|uniref:transposase domain-containing protein n=1 Tax=Parendozoicomonas callyspongiae TaxID=2942213 RepID=UPI0038CD7458